MYLLSSKPELACNKFKGKNPVLYKWEAWALFLPSFLSVVEIRVAIKEEERGRLEFFMSQKTSPSDI